MKTSFSRLIARLIVILTAFASLAGAQTFSVLYAFTDVSQGRQALGPLALDAAGNLYGTAFLGGGPSDYGTVYKLDTNLNFSVLHAFTGTPDGYWPVGGLVLDKSGQHIYGATTRGGRTNRGCGGQCGTIFKLTQAGKETVIYRFGRMHQVFGYFPQFGLIADVAGNLYGTATFGGPDGIGAVFRISKGKYAVLHSFINQPTDGGNPQGPLTLDSAGNFYGTTGFGGTSGNGTVFKIDTTGKETILYNFTGGSDGSQPNNNLVLDANGNLYGTTFSSQFVSAGGTIFKLDPKGNLTVLYTFKGGADGARAGGLVRDAEGNIYGTTGFLGTGGTLFKLDTAGHETILHTFTGGADGAGPGPLIMDAAGNLYGAATGGGNLSCSPTGCGVLFKLTP